MTETTTLAHLSDVHLGPISGFKRRYWNVKRGVGYINWHRTRRKVHLRRVADLIAADVVAQRPDHVAVTGDLANIGLPAEYDAALTWLGSLGETRNISLVPGNHDIYTALLHGASCVETWSPYIGSDAWGAEIMQDIRAPFPYLRRVGQLALIGLNSAVATPLFVASGRLGAPQIEAFATVLDRLKESGLARVVMVHHPPLPKQAPSRRGLIDAEAFAATIAAHGAEVVLHGHNHRDMIAWQASRSGEVPVVGVASASAARAREDEPLARYNLFSFTRDAEGRLTIERIRRGLTDADGTVAELDRLKITSL